MTCSHFEAGRFRRGWHATRDTTAPSGAAPAVTATVAQAVPSGPRHRGAPGYTVEYADGSRRRPSVVHVLRPVVGRLAAT